MFYRGPIGPVDLPDWILTSIVLMIEAQRRLVDSFDGCVGGVWRQRSAISISGILFMKSGYRSEKLVSMIYDENCCSRRIPR